jgi:hypothetical protein
MTTFPELFRGSSLSHGVFEPEKGHRTVHTAATPEDYQDHLEGRLGLGLVPVTEEGTCVFGALDIDIDSIDHGELLKEVSRRNLPLHVCRSKSGGAHCYAFFKEPYKASRVQFLLRSWAALLGYAKCEVFPKQTFIGGENLGNWINLPYYGSDRTTRYCVGPHGAMTLDEFLASVRYYDPEDVVDEEVSQTDLVSVQDMPPCLAELTRDGLPEGTRNAGLYNFAIMYRKALPNGWEPAVTRHNQLYVYPPLPTREVNSIVSSVKRRTYQYKCNEEPICSRCHREECLKTPYGIHNKPWEGGKKYDEFLASNLRKLVSDPPRWLLEVNGQDLELATEELLTFALLAKKAFERTNSLLEPLKQDTWLGILKGLAMLMTELEAPKDSGARGQALAHVYDFLSLFDRARDEEDLLKGVPVRQGDFVLFRGVDVIRYLKSHKSCPEEQVLWALLQGQGAEFITFPLKGKQVTAWKLPVSSLSLQTEEFTKPEFKSLESEL